MITSCYSRYIVSVFGPCSRIVDLSIQLHKVGDSWYMSDGVTSPDQTSTHLVTITLTRGTRNTLERERDREREIEITIIIIDFRNNINAILLKKEVPNFSSIHAHE